MQARCAAGRIPDGRYADRDPREITSQSWLIIVKTKKAAAMRLLSVYVLVVLQLDFVIIYNLSNKTFDSCLNTIETSLRYDC